MLLGAEQLEVMGQKQKVFQLARRTHGNLEKAREFRVTVATAPFCDIGGDRGGAAPKLTGQAIFLFRGETRRDLIDRKREPVRLFPSLNPSEVSQWLTADG